MWIALYVFYKQCSVDYICTQEKKNTDLNGEEKPKKNPQIIKIQNKAECVFCRAKEVDRWMVRLEQSFRVWLPP